MDLPAGFAGRRNEILQLADALVSVGTCPVVFGDRGLGKTSIGRQIERIALGDVELLEELGAGDRAIPEGQLWTPVVSRQPHSDFQVP